jgi:hypothetical protein
MSTRDRYEAEVRKAYDELVAAIAVQESAWQAFDDAEDSADVLAKSEAWEAARTAEDDARNRLADATIAMIERGWDGASQLERFAAVRAVGGVSR